MITGIASSIVPGRITNLIVASLDAQTGGNGSFALFRCLSAFNLAFKSVFAFVNCERLFRKRQISYRVAFG